MKSQSKNDPQKPKKKRRPYRGFATEKLVWLSTNELVSREEYEKFKALFLKTLADANGNVAQTCDTLGIERTRGYRLTRRDDVAPEFLRIKAAAFERRKAALKVARAERARRTRWRDAADTIIAIKGYRFLTPREIRVLLAVGEITEDEAVTLAAGGKLDREPAGGTLWQTPPPSGRRTPDGRPSIPRTAHTTSAARKPQA